MSQYSMDDPLSYDELTSTIEQQVYDSLPEGLVEADWLELPELELGWLELPELDQGWLELPELEQDWLQVPTLDTIEQDLSEPDLSMSTQDFDFDFDR